MTWMTWQAFQERGHDGHGHDGHDGHGFMLRINEWKISEGEGAGQALNLQALEARGPSRFIWGVFFDSSDSNDSNEQVFLLVSIIESKIQQLAHLLGRTFFEHSRSNTILYLSKIYPSFREGWNVQRWVMVLLLPNQSMKVAWRSHVLPRERVHGTMSWSKGPCPVQQQTKWIDRDYNLSVYVCIKICV